MDAQRHGVSQKIVDVLEGKALLVHAVSRFVDRTVKAAAQVLRVKAGRQAHVGRR